MRERLRAVIEALLAEEAAGFPSRWKSEWRMTVHGSPGCCNRAAKLQVLTLVSRTITPGPPPLRDRGERRENRILALFRRETRAEERSMSCLSES
jgi:hypothetical protein